jgi:hypothetical protein
MWGTSHFHKTRRSKTLDRTGRSEIGLWSVIEGFFFFGMATTIAFLKADGNWCNERLRLKITATGSARQGENSRKTQEGILSNPGAELLVLAKAFSTSGMDNISGEEVRASQYCC